MTAYASEEMLRLKFQLDNVAEATPELIAASLDHAHSMVVNRIQEALLDDPPEPVVVAETLLAGGALLRSLASRLALDKREVRLAGHQLETGKRFPALVAVAQAAEQEALHLLTPWLRYDATAETPVLLTTGMK